MDLFLYFCLMIDAIERKLRVLDTFAGAGGFSLGFMMSGGYNIVGAVELDQWAADTFSFNHPDAKVIVGDIRDIKDEEIIEAFGNEIDVLLGGPPCQGFSIANINAGDPKDPRNSLFREFVRFAKVLSPSIVVMENVPNLIKAKTASGEWVIDVIKGELAALGYNVESRILNAAHYGVPQVRKRLVIVATKLKQLKKLFPEASHFVESEGGLNIEGLPLCPTLWDAISDLPDIEACEGAEEMDYTKPPTNDYQQRMRGGSHKVYNHTAMKHSKRMVQRFASMKWGDSTVDVSDEFKPHKRNGNGELSEKAYGQNNRRMYPHRQCHTIAASFYANFVHPFKDRNFTAREGARIQSFPDYYLFKGRPTVPSHSLLRREGRLDEVHLCQYNQIGNAVPPLMAKAIADNILKQL